MTPILISAVTLSQSIAYHSKNDQMVSVPSVTIQLSDRSKFKGDGIFLGGSGFSTAHQQSIVDRLNEIFNGRSADDFFALCQLVDQGTYAADEWRYPEPKQETGEALLKQNRRDMLSVLGVMEPKLPEKQLMPVEFVFPNAIIRATTAALLRAAAYANHKPVFELITAILGNTASEAKSPKGCLRLGLDVSLAAHQPLLAHASALCYSVPASSGSESLGKTAEKFQKYLRDLNNWINESWPNKEPADRPWLFVNLNGTIHRLNGNSTGKTLGSLFGFSTTGNQERMIFANPVENSTLLKAVKDMTLLQSLTKSRKLTLKLAVESETNTLENVSIWLEKCRPEIVVLKETNTANLGDWLKIIQAVVASGTTLILQGGVAGNSNSFELIHTIARAADPEFYIPAGGRYGYLEMANGQSLG